MSEHTAYGAGTLDAGIRSRFVEGINGLTMHILEAGWPTERRAPPPPTAPASCSCTASPSWPTAGAS